MNAPMIHRKGKKNLIQNNIQWLPLVKCCHSERDPRCHIRDEPKDNPEEGHLVLLPFEIGAG